MKKKDVVAKMLTEKKTRAISVQRAARIFIESGTPSWLSFLTKWIDG